MCYPAPKPKAIELILSVFGIEFSGNSMVTVQSEEYLRGILVISEAVTQSIG